MYVHMLFIALMVFLMGMLCLTSSSEMLESKLGGKVSLALFIFWGFRFLTQFFGYSSTLWKGKKKETVIHILFSLLWTYLCVVFFIVYWTNPNANQH
jgi:FlaA1/EpsC-like NDP-sugar epimerase